MQSNILLLAGLLATSSLEPLAHASGALPSGQSLSEIKSASKSLVDAQLRYDASAVSRLLARDFIYVGSDGAVATKAEFVPTPADKKERSLKTLEWKLVKARFYGDTAIGLYLIHERGIRKGKLYEFRGHSLAAWVKQNQRWICTAIHD